MEKNCLSLPARPIAFPPYCISFLQNLSQQLWLQTITVTVDDPSLTAEELYEEENYKHIHYQYQLYDLDGTVPVIGGATAVIDNIYLRPLLCSLLLFLDTAACA